MTSFPDSRLAELESLVKRLEQENAALRAQKISRDGVFHDLRNYAMNLYCAVELSESDPTADHAALLRKFGSNLDFIQRMANRALAEQTLTGEAVDMASVGRDVISRFSCLPSYADKRVVIDAPSPAFAKANRGLVEQTFFNLLGNAFDHSISSVKVTVERNSRWVVTDVYNDGEPISRHALSRLWEPKDKGVHGYGLPCVRQSVERMGGMIEYMPDPSGVRFRTLLPPLAA